MDVRVAEEGERGRRKVQTTKCSTKVSCSSRGRFTARNAEKLQSRFLQVAQIVSIAYRFNRIKEECPKKYRMQNLRSRKGSIPKYQRGQTFAKVENEENLIIYCMIFHYIAFYCMIFNCIAWYCISFYVV